ncbi:MAG TPA: hypothetical protein VLB12_17260 [Gemmatimonadales bacterium]|nr:hypothetical protein [Gemmatimonadales bacterium]
MYRIRLANGEETVFRSIEELSLGIASGVIAPDAEIYHKKSRSWLPIRTHPDYQAALEQRPIALDEPEATRDVSAPPVVEISTVPEPVPATSEDLPEATEPGTTPDVRSLDDLPLEDTALTGAILQMESRSGRELLLRRRNPIPIMAAVGGIATAVIVVVLFVLPRPTPPLPEATKPPNIAATHPDPLPLTPNAAPTTVESLAASPGEPVTQKLGELAPTPEELATRRDLARDRQIKALDQGIAKLSFTRLFTTSRLATADSVKLTRRAIGPLRTMLTQYRSSTAQIDITYQDSAERLGASGVWPVGALTNWKAKGPASEDKVEVAQSDSLLDAIDRLFAILSDEEGEYTSNADSISFNDASAAADYADTRNLIEHLTEAGSTDIPSHVPLARLAAAANPLPPLVTLHGKTSSAPAPKPADTAQQH